MADRYIITIDMVTNLDPEDWDWPNLLVTDSTHEKVVRVDVKPYNLEEQLRGQST